MRFLRVLFIISLMLICSSIWAKSTPKTRIPEVIQSGTTLTLEECINLALRNQPTIRQAQAQLQIGTGAVSIAQSALYPDVSVNGSTSLGGSKGNTGTTINGGASQLLYDFGRTRSLLNQTKQQRIANIYGLSAAKSDVVFNVKQAFYILLRSNRLVKVFEANLKDQKDHVAEAQARLDIGVAPKSDLLTAQSAEASAVVDLITAQNTAAQSLITLNIAMGLDVRSDTQITESTEPESPVLALDDLVILAIKNRAEIAQAVSQVDAANDALKSSKKGNFPTLTASANNNVTIDTPTSGSSLSLALNLQWRPVDFGLTKGQITESEGQLLLAEESLYIARQTVSGDTASARLDFIAASASLTAATAEVASAQENLDAAIGRYQAGIGIFIQITDAQALLLKAEVDQAVALYGLSIARAELEHATGARTPKGTFNDGESK